MRYFSWPLVVAGFVWFFVLKRRLPLWMLRSSGSRAAALGRRPGCGTWIEVLPASEAARRKTRTDRISFRISLVKSIRGFLFHLLSVLSLLLCVATIALWVRSYWRYDGLGSPTVHSRSWELNSGRGQFSASINDWLTPTPNSEWGYTTEPLWPGMWLPFGDRSTLGFKSGHEQWILGPNPAPSYRSRYVVVPDWFLLLLTAALPGFWMVRFHRRRRGQRTGFPVLPVSGAGAKQDEGG